MRVLELHSLLTLSTMMGLILSLARLEQVTHLAHRVHSKVIRVKSAQSRCPMLAQRRHRVLVAFKLLFQLAES